jgi:hypothetical protein
MPNGKTPKQAPSYSGGFDPDWIKPKAKKNRPKRPVKPVAPRRPRRPVNTPAPAIEPPPVNTFTSNDRELDPLSNDIHIGYGVDTPTRYPIGANARFINQNQEQLPLYVTEVELNLEMAGDIAQSLNVRQFFPSNLVQPSILISGIMPSSYHYNNLANFVALTHRLAVSTSSDEDPLMTFELTDPQDIELKDFPYEGRQITKGIRPPIEIKGYIQGAQAGGKKENHAPEWQITMMVAQMVKGPWTEEPYEASDLPTWAEMFLERDEKDFIQPPGQREPGKKPKKPKPKKPKDNGVGGYGGPGGPGGPGA